MSKKNVMSRYDLFVTIVVTVVGTSLFSYPRVLTEKIGTDGWFVIILSGIILLPFLYILCKAAKVNKFKRLTEMLEDSLGSIIGRIVAIYIALAGVFIISIEMRTFVEVIKMYLLDRTPTEFILFLMIIVGSFLVRGEIESVIKFNEIAFWLMFVPVILSILFLLHKADFTNIFPVFTHSPIEYIKASQSSLYSLIGFGIIYMILPLVNEKDDIFKVAFKSVAFIVVFYLVIFLSTLFVFPSNYNSKLLWPTITALSTVDIPGAFIERWEGLVMVFWIVFYFTTYVNILYFVSEIVKDVFQLEDVKISVVLILPFIYLLSLYPQNIAEVYDMRKRFVPFIDTVVVGILPIVLLATGLTRGNNSRRKRNEV